jgi:hypothetical protein
MKEDEMTMQIEVFMKNKKEPIIYTADRIDVLDFEIKGVKYKQVRYFRKGFSKSEYIEESLIKRIVEK